MTLRDAKGLAPDYAFVPSGLQSPKRQQREDHMHSLNHRFLHRLLLAGAVALTAVPAVAADVTPQRLTNPEPGNWLMNHRTYDAQRHSPLDKINRGNVKGLRLTYAVALGGTAVNENLEATPLAEDGFLYVTDHWSALYKIDARSGDLGRIMW